LRLAFGWDLARELNDWFRGAGIAVQKILSAIPPIRPLSAKKPIPSIYSADTIYEQATSENQIDAERKSVDEMIKILREMDLEKVTPSPP
jgi:hypothetical protein